MRYVQKSRHNVLLSNNILISIWVPAETWSGLDIFTLTRLVDQRHIQVSTVQQVTDRRLKAVLIPFTSDIDLFLDQFRERHAVLAGVTAVDIMFSNRGLAWTHIHVLFPRKEGLRFQQHFILTQGYHPVDPCCQHPGDDHIGFMQMLRNSYTGKHILTHRQRYRTFHQVRFLMRFDLHCSRLVLHCVFRFVGMQNGDHVQRQPHGRLSVKANMIRAQYGERGFRWIGHYPQLWRQIGDPICMLGALTEGFDPRTIIEILQRALKWRVKQVQTGMIFT